MCFFVIYRLCASLLSRIVMLSSFMILIFFVFLIEKDWGNQHCNSRYSYNHKRSEHKSAQLTKACTSVKLMPWKQPMHKAQSTVVVGYCSPSILSSTLCQYILPYRNQNEAWRLQEAFLRWVVQCTTSSCIVVMEQLYCTCGLVILVGPSLHHKFSRDTRVPQSNY